MNAGIIPIVLFLQNHVLTVVRPPTPVVNVLLVTPANH